MEVAVASTPLLDRPVTAQISPVLTKPSAGLEPCESEPAKASAEPAGALRCAAGEKFAHGNRIKSTASRLAEDEISHMGTVERRMGFIRAELKTVVQEDDVSAAQIFRHAAR